MIQRRYFRDDPAPDHDTLERSDFAERIVDALSEIRQQSTSSVSGLIAPWGAGKSTVLAMVLESLKEHSDGAWTVVELNPWLYSDADALQLGFFVALREALPRGRKWSRKRERVGNFFTAIAPFGKVNGLAGVDASSAMESMGKWISGDVSASALKDRASDALAELENPIIVVMDDLDRLTPDELLMVFKLVRLVGRLPNVYYLLAYDEKTLLDLIQQTQIAAGDRGRAREYMEKIVQVRFDTPPLRPRQAANLVDEAVGEICARHAISLTPDDSDRFGTSYRRYLSGYLTTPRSINRYFAQVDALYGGLNAEVNFVDFALLTFLRTFEPETYANVCGPWRDELLGSKFSLELKREDNETKKQRWLELLRESRVDENKVDGLLELLALLFPTIRMITQNFSGGLGTMLSAAANGQRLGHRDYFDRYISFGIPGDDTSDTAVSGWIAELETSTNAAVISAMCASLERDTARAARKIEKALAGYGNAAARILPMLADVRARVTHEFFSINGSPAISVEVLAATALHEVPTPCLASTIEEMDSFEYGAILASEALNDMGSLFPEADTAHLRVAVSKVLENRVRRFMSHPLRDVSSHDFRHVYHWRRAAGNEVTDPVLRQVLTEGPWSAIEFAEKCVTVATSQGGIETLSDLQVDVLEEIAGLEFFYTELSQLLDEAPDHIARHRYEVTDDNRRIVALSQLKQRRAADRRSSADDGSD